PVPPFWIERIFISAISSSGKCIRVRRRRNSVLILDVAVSMDAADFFLGADNTTMKLTFGSNLCTRPQNCVLKDGARADLAVFSDNRAAPHLCTRINDGCFRDALRPVPVPYVLGRPT